MSLVVAMYWTINPWVVAEIATSSKHIWRMKICAPLPKWTLIKKWVQLNVHYQRADHIIAGEQPVHPCKSWKTQVVKTSHSWLSLGVVTDVRREGRGIWSNADTCGQGDKGPCWRPQAGTFLLLQHALQTLLMGEAYQSINCYLSYMIYTTLLWVWH